MVGLWRLGWAFPLPASLAAQGAAFHGPLMVSAFFGTVIALERAVALATGWAYLGPALAGAARPGPAARRATGGGRRQRNIEDTLIDQTFENSVDKDLGTFNISMEPVDSRVSCSSSISGLD